MGGSGVIRRRLVMRGVVQGVGYRFSAARAAALRDVSGWVRNRADGTVEAVLEGSPEAVESMVEWCRRGPPGAIVADIDVREETPEGIAGFSAT
jgi:acylphosphatase